MKLRVDYNLDKVIVLHMLGLVDDTASKLRKLKDLLAVF